MTSTPGRQRGSRPQVQNEIGVFGRTTGIKPPDPKRVHRDSNGFENPEDYFKRARSDGESDDESEPDDDDSGSTTNRKRQAQPSSSSSRRKQPAARGRDRPDKFIPGEGRGRKTGAVVAEGRRDSDGLEDPGEFFDHADFGSSSSPTGSVATTSYHYESSAVRRNSRRTARQSASSSSSSRTTNTFGTGQTRRSANYDEFDDEFDQGDASTTMSPTTTTSYQRQTKLAASVSTTTTTGGGGRKPSSLRHSIVPSEATSRGARSSIEYDPDEAEQDEQETGSSSVRRRTAFDAHDEDEGDEPVIEEYDLASDAEHDGEADTTIGDRTLQGQVISDEEEEEEEGASDEGPNRFRTLASSSNKKVQAARQSVVVAVASDNKNNNKGKRRAATSESDEEEVGGGGGGREASSKGKKRSRASEVAQTARETRRSSVGLVKLDRNGKATPIVDKGKGKGKAKDVVAPRRREKERDDDDDDDEGRRRSPSPRFNDYHDDDFGGGLEDDEEAANFDYGPGGGGDLDDDREPSFRVADEEEDVARAPEIRVEEVDSDAGGERGGEGEEESRQIAASSSSSKKTKKKKSKLSTAPAAAARPSSLKGRGKKRRSDDDAAAGASNDGDDRSSPEVAKRSRKTSNKNQLAVVESVRSERQAGSVEVEGVRRSNRQRLQPLEYWRNERVIYKKRASGVGMTAIVRVPKIEPEPLTQAGRKRSRSSAPASGRGSKKKKKRARSVKTETDSSTDDDDDDDDDAREGRVKIDSMTDPDGLVWSWEGNAETTRRIAFTEHMMDPKPAFNNQYQFQKIYQELDYLAGGILDIPVGGRKDTKPAKDNSYLFYCARGSVSVLCHRTRIAIGKGGTFFIPRGNSYSIESTSSRPVRLFFAQGRRVIELEDGSTRGDTREASQLVREAQEQQALLDEDERVRASRRRGAARRDASDDNDDDRTGSEEEEEEE